MFEENSEIIKPWYYLIVTMKTCSICHKISATDEDHLDCQQKRRVELEDAHTKQKLPEKLDLEKNLDDVNVDIKAILDHMKREKVKKS